MQNTMFREGCQIQKIMCSCEKCISFSMVFGCKVDLKSTAELRKIGARTIRKTNQHETPHKNDFGRLWGSVKAVEIHLWPPSERLLAQFWALESIADRPNMVGPQKNIAFLGARAAQRRPQSLGTRVWHFIWESLMLLGRPEPSNSRFWRPFRREKNQFEYSSGPWVVPILAPLLQRKESVRVLFFTLSFLQESGPWLKKERAFMGGAEIP